MSNLLNVTNDVNITQDQADKILSDFMKACKFFPVARLALPDPSRKNASVELTRESFGCYDRADGSARVFLRGKYYMYKPRKQAISTWFASELSRYKQNLVVELTEAKDDNDPDKEFDTKKLLSGIMSSSYDALEENWGTGDWCAVSFTGVNIPGIVLRVDTVKFEDKEVMEMATHIVNITYNVYNEFLALERTHDMIYRFTSKVAVIEKIKIEGSDIFKSNKGKGPFDLRVVNINPTADVLVDRLKNITSKPAKDRPAAITCLFYGAPGTGKSMLATHIADELEMGFIKKTYGDLQSMYVSEGEKQLKAAFEEAEKKKSILLIDEIDSIAGNRDSADRDYQKTFTNELLTCLDEFKGIFIATSNKMEELDPAILRRLFLKLEFDFLEKDQVERCLELYFPQFKGQAKVLNGIKYLAPGDFKVAQNAALFDGTVATIERVRELLSQEVERKIKTMPELKLLEKNPFGFGSNK